MGSGTACAPAGRLSVALVQLKEGPVVCITSLSSQGSAESFSFPKSQQANPARQTAERQPGPRPPGLCSLATCSRHVGRGPMWRGLPVAARPSVHLWGDAASMWARREGEPGARCLPDPHLLFPFLARAALGNAFGADLQSAL